MHPGTCITVCEMEDRQELAGAMRQPMPKLCFPGHRRVSEGAPGLDCAGE